MRIDYLDEAARPEVVAAIRRYASLDSDYHQTHVYRYARTLETILQQLEMQSDPPRSPRRSVLEIGTSGVFPLVLNDLVADLDVLVTHEDVNRAVESQLVFDHDPRARQFRSFSVNIEIDSLPLEDSSVDVVLLCEVIEHLELDPMRCLVEINRILVPGGLLVITTPNICSGRAAVKMLMGVSPYFFMKYTTTYGRHNYEYTVHDLRVACEAAGFVMSALWTEDNFEDPHPAAVEMIEQAGGSPDHRGDNIIGLFVKDGPVLNRYPAELYVQ